MRLLNRTIVVLKPKQPYIDWANSFDDDGPKLTLESASEDCTVLLIPEVDGNEEVDAFLAGHATELFEAELDGWMSGGPPGYQTLSKERSDSKISQMKGISSVARVVSQELKLAKQRSFQFE